MEEDGDGEEGEEGEREGPALPDGVDGRWEGHFKGGVVGGDFALGPLW